MRAFGTVYAGWAYSQQFFREATYCGLGYDSVQELLDDWAADHEKHDANDLLAVLGTWQRADAGGHGREGLEAALGGVSARCIVMPGSSDLYFPVADSEREAALVPGAELRILESELGHVAGRPGIRQVETEQIRAAVRELLGER